MCPRDPAVTPGSVRRIPRVWPCRVDPAVFIDVRDGAKTLEVEARRGRERVVESVLLPAIVACEPAVILPLSCCSGRLGNCATWEICAEL